MATQHKKKSEWFGNTAPSKLGQAPGHVPILLVAKEHTHQGRPQASKNHHRRQWYCRMARLTRTPMTAAEEMLSPPIRLSPLQRGLLWSHH